ncbi:DUF4383 domain-containing protein [Frondihabitans cladoniiphilus]|uniref:DUF4383 domain-containing protein n=1 Tax=Frondihabitans cladoniiphilus TaxID=715785 RepID=A0ABP8VRZ5_9MICO
MSTTTTRPAQTFTRLKTGPAQGAATVVGILMVVFGILGFIPGVTQHLGEIHFIGPSSTSFIFNIFQNSIFSNIVWIVFGLIGLGAARAPFSLAATGYLLGFGMVFLVIWLYGLAFMDWGGNFFPFNLADQSLNVGLGFALLLTGAATSQLAMKGSRYDEGLWR